MNTFLTSEYPSALADPSFRLTAEKLVLKIGVRADLKGYDCLVDAVILYGTELCTRFCDIYRIIGGLRRLKHKSVMREISYAVYQAFDLPRRLSALVGADIPASDIHNSLIIAYLGKLFRNPSLAVYE